MTVTSGWYAKNGVNAYPLAGDSTGLDDGGRELPDDIILDLRMFFPGDPEHYAYLRSVEISDGATIVVISRSDGQLLATARVEHVSSSPQQVVELVAAADDVRGWIVLSDRTEPWYASFAAPQQSKLSAGACRRTAPLIDEARISRLGFEHLRNERIQIVGNGDISVRRSPIELAGALRNAVVIGLQDQPDRNLLLEYAGICGGRPESDTCGDPAPIETINNVQADCCGRVFIEFRGCVDIEPIVDTCGVLVSCPLSVEEACPVSEQEPTPDGRLPDEKDIPDDPADENCVDDLGRPDSTQASDLQRGIFEW